MAKKAAQGIRQLFPQLSYSTWYLWATFQLGPGIAICKYHLTRKPLLIISSQSVTAKLALLMNNYCSVVSSLHCALILSETLALHKSFTYLLTYLKATSDAKTTQ